MSLYTPKKLTQNNEVKIRKNQEYPVLPQNLPTCSKIKVGVVSKLFKRVKLVSMIYPEIRQCTYPCSLVAVVHKFHLDSALKIQIASKSNCSVDPAVKQCTTRYSCAFI